MRGFGCIIPVAGLSSRMNEFKPLMKIGSKTMIEHTVDSVLNAGIERCILILGFNGKLIEKELKNKNENIDFIYNTEYAVSDMLYSIKLGLIAMQKYDTRATFILPGDMPGIQSNTLEKIYNTLIKTDANIVFPTISGKRKHPPLISSGCYKSIVDFRGDGGLRSAIQLFGQSTIELPVDDIGCCLDADNKFELGQLMEYMKTK